MLVFYLMGVFIAILIILITVVIDAKDMLEAGHIWELTLEDAVILVIGLFASWLTVVYFVYHTMCKEDKLDSDKVVIRIKPKIYR
jgi:hypothetical protein